MKKSKETIIKSGVIEGILDMMAYDYDLIDNCNSKSKFIEIPDEIIEEYEIEELSGYSIRCKRKYGDHKNDGQLVEYTFEIKNKEGKKASFETDMSLMSGWNMADLKLNFK